MPVTDIQKDPEALTLTVIADFAVPVERVWRVWDDPRQLERWWGPPEYPATVVDHDLSSGGRVDYHMTGPEGDRHHGYWKVVAVEAPRRLEVEDGFADEDGNPNPELPVTAMRMTLDEGAEGGTRMTMTSRFPSLEAMEQLTEMGMEEGLTAAMAQIDDLLKAPTDAENGVEP